MDWFVPPESCRLELPDGQWILVKKRLTVGEEKKAQARLIKEVRSDGRVTPDFEMIGKAEVMAYLLDWSATDAQGPIPIKTDEQMRAAIDALPTETFDLLSKSITAHIAAMTAERAETKNGQGGASNSSQTS